METATAEASSPASSAGCSTSSRSSGFTLVEAVFSVLIVGAMLVAVLGTVGAVGRAHLVRERERTADALARALLAEAMCLPLDDPNDAPILGVEVSERTSSTRAVFDDVDDYHNWSASPPQRRDGSVLPGLAGWRRSCQVSFVNPLTLAPSATRTPLARVTVRVTAPGGHAYVQDGLRAAAAGPVPGSGAGVEWIGIELRPAGARRTIYSGVRPANRPPVDQDADESAGGGGNNNGGGGNNNGGNNGGLIGGILDLLL